MDARETNDIGNSLESPSIDLAQIKRKYIVNSKSTLQNVLTEYGLPQEDRKKKKVNHCLLNGSLFMLSEILRTICNCFDFDFDLGVFNVHYKHSFSRRNQTSSPMIRG